MGDVREGENMCDVCICVHERGNMYVMCVRERIQKRFIKKNREN